MGRVDITYNARVCQFYIPSGKVNISVDSCSTRRNCITHGKTELDAAGFIRADENDKRAPA